MNAANVRRPSPARAPPPGPEAGWSGPPRSADTLESRLVDGEAEPVAGGDLVVGEAPLRVLGDHVDVLEVALERATLVHRGGPRGVVHGVDDLGGQADAMGGGDAEGRALLEGQAAAGGGGPDVTDGLDEEGATAAELGLDLTDGGLDGGLVTEHLAHAPGCLGAGQLVERSEAASCHAERHRSIAGGEQEGARDPVERP